MAKSRGRKFAELVAPTNGVFAAASLPTIALSKLANSTFSVNSESASLGGNVVLDSNDITEHTNALYFTNARAQGSLSVAANSGHGALSYDNSNGQFTFAGITTEALQDVVGAMFSSNTETAVTVTYQDSDGTIDLIVDDTTKVPLAGGTMTGNLTLGDNVNAYFGASTDLRIYHDGTNSHIINSTGELRFTGSNFAIKSDSNKLYLGAGDDLKLYHTGSHSYIENGTGTLFIDAAQVNILDGANTAAAFTAAGATTLYHNGSAKLATNSGGVTVTGTAILGGATFVDNATAYFGTGLDLRIYHDGTHSRIKNNEGQLWLQSDTGIRFTDSGVNESMAAFYDNGAVELYYDGAKKFETTTSGIQTTGTLNVNGAYTLPTSDGSANQVLQTDGSGTLSFANAGSGSSVFSTSGSDIYYNSGNVGIGTTSPGRLLDVGGSGQGGIVGFKGGNYNQINIAHSSNSGWGMLLTNSNSTSNTGYHTSTSGQNNSVALVNVNDDAIHFGTNNTHRMTIDHDGYVGIGTVDPISPLHISNSTDQHIILSGATNPYIRFQEASTNKAFIQWNAAGYLEIKNQEDASGIRIKDAPDFSLDGSTYHTIWHAGNDGADSGLDADTLDGVQLANIARTDIHETFTSNITVNGNIYTGDGNDGYFYNDANGRTAFSGGDFYIQNSVSNYYNYATNQYIGDSSGDNIYFRGNVLSGTGWQINGSGALTTRDHQISAGYHLTRGDHHTGYLEGSYNNVGANSAKSNPIYSIGSGYVPADAGFGNMYGIGYSHSNFWGTGSGKPTDWGLYVCQNGSPFFMTTSTGTWSSGQFNRNGNTVWDAGNDGPGSGLDADTLDTIQGKKIQEGLARIAGWEPGYSNNTEASVYYDYGERAIVIDGANDTNNGAVFKAVRVEAGDEVRFTVQIKGSAVNSNGMYVRLYAHNGEMPAGKTHVSNDEANSSAFVQEDDAGDTGWHENGAVSTSYVTFTRTWAASQTQFVSLVVLNWTAYGTGKLYVRNPDIALLKVNDSHALDGSTGGKYMKTGAGDAVSGWWIGSARNGNSGSPQIYFSHSSGYGQHINTYNTSGSIYALQVHNNSKELFVVNNDGTVKANGGHLVVDASGTFTRKAGGIQVGSSSALSNSSSLLALAGTSPYISFHHGSAARTGYIQEASNRLYFGEFTYTEDPSSFRSPIFYDSTDTTYYVRPGSSSKFNGDIFIDGNYGRGIVGVYSSTRYQHVWMMGSSYRTNASGTSYGNAYGLTWTHTNVGTGTNESISGLSHQLQVRANGTLWCAFGAGIWTTGNVTAYSDIAVKTNLKVIPNALEKVCSISGYTYDRTDFVPDPETGEMPETRQAGVVAQEVEKVLPEVVSGEEGNKSVAYGNMVSILIEAIKELKTEVDELKAQLNKEK